MTELIKLALVAAAVFLMWPGEAKPAEPEAMVLVVIELTGDETVAKVSTELFLRAYQCLDAASKALERPAALATQCLWVDLDEETYYQLFGDQI